MIDIEEIAAFLADRYDERERAVKDGLCIACGHPVRHRYVTEFGVREWRGYEHDERRDSTGRMHRWQGVRCEGGMTGAEPVQRPDLVLVDLEAKRAILDRVVPAIRADERLVEGEWGSGIPDLAGHENSGLLLCLLAAEFAGHSKFMPEWSVA